MSKPKGGLQKKVSSIFDGVPMESEAAHSGVRHGADAAGKIPAVEARAAVPVPVAPPAPVASTPAVKPPVTVAPTVWPKAPAVQPEPEKPKTEPKPKSALAAALNADTDVPAPKTTPIRLEPPRPSAPSRAAAEKPAAAPAPKVMGKVVVKHSAGDSNKKTAMFAGLVVVVLILAFLWSGGYLSGGSSTPPIPSSVQQASLAPVKIDWQRPSAPPLSRNPMRPGGGSSVSGTNQRPGQDGTSSSLTVKGTFWSEKDGFAAMMGDGVVVRKGDTYHEVKITSITKGYVEYEQGGARRREYVDAKDNRTGSQDVMPDANSQNIK